MADYGTDLSCTFDMSPDAAEVSGNRLLAEALFRRLTTPRGRLLSDPDYGTDLTAYIFDDMNASGVSALSAAIRAECKKDQRVASVTVQITTPPNLDGKYLIAIGVNAAQGPFTMTVSASSVNLALLTVS